MPVDLSDAALHATLHRTAKILGLKLPDSPGNFRDMVPFILEEMANRLAKPTAKPEKPDGRTTKRR